MAENSSSPGLSEGLPGEIGGLPRESEGLTGESEGLPRESEVLQGESGGLPEKSGGPGVYTTSSLHFSLKIKLLKLSVRYTFILLTSILLINGVNLF